MDGREECAGAFNVGLVFGIMIGILAGMSIVAWVLMNGVL